MRSLEYPRLAFSDPEGKILDHPHLKLAGRSGDRMVLPQPSELVPLPMGVNSSPYPAESRLMGRDTDSFISSEKTKMGRREIDCAAVAAFLPWIYTNPPSCNPIETKCSNSSALGLQFRRLERWKVLGDRPAHRPKPPLASKILSK
jgi:hypothetical protein